MIVNLNMLAGSGGGGTGTTYTAGDYIQISGTTISATGVTSEEHSEEVEGIIAGAMEDLNSRIPTIATTIDSGSTDSEAASAKAVYDALGNVGGSDYLPEIDTLPENPEDGALYNYKGRLIKYVNGSGNWGEWRVRRNKDTKYGSICAYQNAVLNYVTIPSSMDSQLMCQVYWNLAQSIYFFYDATNNYIKAYADSGATTPAVSGDTIEMNGTEYEVWTGGTVKAYVTWKDGQIVFQTRSAEFLYKQVCATAIQTAHFEVMNPQGPVGYDPATSAYTHTVYVNDNGEVVGLGLALQERTVYVNGGIKSYISRDVSSSVSIPNIYAPTASGATGTMLVSAGNTAPEWKTVAQALGVDFWTGTQAQYDALAPNYNATTLYIIVEE